MKKLSTIKNYFEIEKFLTNNEHPVFSAFINGYKKAGENFNYKLFHQYIFRTDTIDVSSDLFFYKENIVFKKNGKIDFSKTKNVYKTFSHRIALYIGCIWSNSNKTFVPIFLSLMKYDSKDNYFIINGFTIWEKPRTYQYGITSVDYFNKKTTADIGKFDIEQSLYFDPNDSDYYIGDERFKSIKNILKEYADNTNMHLMENI